MFLIRRGVFAAGLLLAGRVVPAWGRASLYIPLDDSRLPLVEHLIVRGDIEDPSPFIRPFRLSDAVRVLGAADTAPETPAGSLVRRLRAEFTEDTTAARWAVDARVGGQAYTQKRRDPLHLGGPGTANWYFDIGLKGVLGPFAVASRPAAEPSLIGDPDWPNETQEHVTGRLIEGYASGQVRFGSLTFGQLQRNWGPVGLPGIPLPLSDCEYERQGLALELGTGRRAPPGHRLGPPQRARRRRDRWDKASGWAMTALNPRPRACEATAGARVGRNGTRNSRLRAPLGATWARWDYL